ncbi:calcium-binding protein PBP1-like [Ananas comosus]|uniref:Calcium-binding protein PBP1-like n=1 Tax=Ananas comosus TaxID=4615 RepID=A0A6P5G2Q3_ANACO|nr:calcium-binding protein PBP1-like [Ananas comosus]
MATDGKDIHSSSAAASVVVGFEDYLPWMAERLGEEGLMEELCKGFQLLMDQRSGLITFQSLKRNAAALGLGQLGDEELMGMVREGDVDGDGALDQMEFCVLMLRLSPQLMDDYSQKLLLGEAFPADDHI